MSALIALLKFEKLVVGSRFGELDESENHKRMVLEASAELTELLEALNTMIVLAKLKSVGISRGLSRVEKEEVVRAAEVYNKHMEAE